MRVTGSAACGVTRRRRPSAVRAVTVPRAPASSARSIRPLASSAFSGIRKVPNAVRSRVGRPPAVRRNCVRTCRVRCCRVKGLSPRARAGASIQDTRWAASAALISALSRGQAFGGRRESVVVSLAFIAGLPRGSAGPRRHLSRTR
ncbi:hypothetical protein DEJ49_34500 [Streptomyces venezuelae]|uniref:Uncharacterized protein n=1 Tax=Streptomyces venezuelae TaxID=54571 RepID=A0A5P2CRE0_STRVZ|nr:hypothetical protein DEJ49_34500 [Streptomyces venezuelae]